MRIGAAFPADQTRNFKCCKTIRGSADLNDLPVFSPTQHQRIFTDQPARATQPELFTAPFDHQDHAPPLSGEIAFLLKYGFSRTQLQAVERRARLLGLPAADVLLANGYLSDVAYFNLIARELGLPFWPVVPNGHDVLPHLPAPHQWSRMARMAAYAPQCSSSLFNQRRAEFFIAPDGAQLAALRQMLRKSPHHAHRLKITTHQGGWNHLVARARPALLDTAINGLKDIRPELSAKQVATNRQTVVAIVGLQLFIGIGLWADGLVVAAFHLPALLAYFGQAGLRLLAWAKCVRLTRSGMCNFCRTRPCRITPSLLRFIRRPIRWTR